MKKFPLLMTLSACLGVAVFLALQCIDSFHNQTVPTLEWFASFYTTMEPSYILLKKHNVDYLLLGGVVSAFLSILLCCVSIARRSRDGSLFFAAVTAAIAAQTVLYREYFYLAGALYILASILLFFYSYGSRPEISWEKRESRSVEYVFFILLFSLAAGIRFYNLNLIPNYWDGELCNFRATATDITTSLASEFGFYDPKGSMGLLWRIFHGLGGAWFGHSLLMTRIVGVCISIAGIPVIYLFLRMLGGPLTAFIGTFIYYFGPLELGMSRLPSYHHLPAIIMACTAGATYKALTEKKNSWLVAAIVFACLTSAVYPSGVFGVLIPVAAAFHQIFFGEKGWRDIRRPFILAAGSLSTWALNKYLISLALLQRTDFVSPLPVHQPFSHGLEQNESMLSAMINRFIINIELLFTTFFYKEPAPSHWNPFATFEPVTPLSAFVIVLGTLGFLLAVFRPRKLTSVIFIVWVIAALMPGVFSTDLATRRIGTVYLAFPCIAALVVQELFWITRGVLHRYLSFTIEVGFTVLVVGILLLSQATYFFAVRPEYSRDLVYNDLIRKKITDNTLLVMIAPAWMQCQQFYSMYDLLLEKGGNVAIGAPVDEKAVEFLNEPRPSTDIWYYQNTGLIDQTLVVEKKDFKRIVYFFNNFEYQRYPWLSLVQDRFPQAKKEEISICTSEKGSVCEAVILTVDR